jgi:hypothetical protein
MEKDNILYLAERQDKMDISLLEVFQNPEIASVTPVFIKITWASGKGASIALTTDQAEEFIEKLQDLIK